MWNKALLFGFLINFVNTDIDVLTKNLFANLEADPKLLADYDLNPSSKQFIDRQIDNYIKLMREKRQNENSQGYKKKRSLSDSLITDLTGNYVLNAVTPTTLIPATFPSDIQLFRQDNQWFAAALESSEIASNADSLTIYQYKNESFVEIARENVTNAVKLALTNTDDGFTLIAIAVNSSAHNEKSSIYQFANNNLKQIQSLKLLYANDIVMWRMHDEIFMGVAHFMLNRNNNNFSYETTSRVYKWLGGHFDWIQSISTNGAKKLTHFTIGGGQFLAVANSRNDRQTSEVYSEIFKYDYSSERYELYQRILTRGCGDIKYFSLRNSRYEKEHFLVVANTFELNKQQINYKINSILYKFVDDYFIPFQSFRLNTLEQWLPVQGPNREFILIGVTKFEGLKLYEYDGWTFVENFSLNNNLLKGKGIQSIHHSNFNHSSIIVANKNNNGKIPNVFALDFVHSNPLKTIHSEIMSWCKTSLDKIVPKDSDEFFEAILGNASRADVDDNAETTDSDIDQSEFDEMNSQLDSLNLILDDFNAQLQKTPQQLQADKVIFNNNAVINNLNTAKINSFNASELVEDSLDITKGFELNSMDLDEMQTENEFKPVKINGNDVNKLIYRNSDLAFDKVKINGVLMAPKGLNVNGKVNGIDFNDQNLLLSVGDQTIFNPVQFNEIQVDHLTAKSINDVNLSTLSRNEKDNEQQIFVDHIENLTVDNLFIAGFINDVDIAVIDKYALKKSGNQLITKTYTIDTITGPKLQVNGLLSNRHLDDLIHLDQDIIIQQDLLFSTPPKINNLTIIDTLNGIKVIDKKLDVLLKDSKEKQTISGQKLFENMIIYQPVDIRTKITSEHLKKFNPVLSIDQEVIVEKDLTISGNVNIEQVLKTKDIVANNSNYSATKLEMDGLKLTEKEILLQLHFKQQLHVDEIFLEQINGMEVSNFVVNGDNKDQRIYGRKIFNGNLHINGPTTVQAINNVNLAELDGNVLKINEDQTILATHQYKHVLAEKIAANSFNFENNRTDFNKLISDNVTFNADLQVFEIKTKELIVQNKVNNLNFNKIVADTVQTTNTNVKITGLKTVNMLKINDATIENGFNLHETATIFENGLDNIDFDGPIDIHKPISIKNLNFETSLNGLDKASFGEMDVDGNGNQLVHGDRVFNKIVVQEALIKNNKINQINIEELAHNTVKIDEPFEFNSGVFEKTVISVQPLQLDGQIEKVDLDNIVLSHMDLQQVIFDQKTFKEPISVNGTIRIDGLVNGFNLTEFDQIMSSNSEPKNVVIEGNAIFTKGPNVAQINQVKVKDIAENAWFNDQNTNLKGYFQFNDVVFHEDVEIGGFVDNISLSIIKDNYFSKSRDQIIPATFTFDNLIFESNATVNQMFVNEKINNVNFDEFTRTILLDDVEQVFETVLFLETCKINNEALGEFTVNDFNLESDVMRYDKVNMVTGAKTFNNLNVNLLKTEKNIHIQDVDVLNWFKLAALKTSSCNITGTKTLMKNVVFSNGIGINGILNNFKFDIDNVMVKNLPQQITGKKLFKTNKSSPIMFKSIKLKGQLNNISISDLMNNQAFKNKENTFDSPLIFHNNINTSNLMISGNYQGINMTDLIANVTNLGALNNLVDNYRDLGKMLNKLDQSLKHQAYFVQNYKLAQTMANSDKSLILHCPDGVNRIGLIVNKESNLQLEMFGWNNDLAKFQLDNTMDLRPSREIHYMDQVLMGRYLYIEEAHNGRFLNMDTDNTFNIATNRTKRTASFPMPHSGENCILFIYYECIPKIFCETANGKLEFMQEFDTHELYKDAKSLLVNETPFLFTINEAIDGGESNINIWKLNKTEHKFQLLQSMFAAEATSLAVVYYNNFYYLAIASGNSKNPKDSGRIEISRFDEKSQQFELWQSIILDAPLQIEFSVLPSGELVLYVLTDNPTEPLLIYNYAGIAGFGQIVVGFTLPNTKSISQIMGGVDQHFIIAQSDDEINVIQAIFKGEKIVNT